MYIYLYEVEYLHNNHSDSEVELTCAKFQHTNFTKTNLLPLPDLSLINPLSQSPKNISEEALMNCSYLEGMLLCIMLCCK